MASQGVAFPIDPASPIGLEGFAGTAKVVGLVVNRAGPSSGAGEVGIRADSPSVRGRDDGLP